MSDTTSSRSTRTLGGRAHLPAVLPATARDIGAAAARCRKLATRRALVSAGAAAVPVPGIDIAVDIPLLMKLLDDINGEFGLTPEQIERLAPRRRVNVHKAIAALGSTAIGRTITRQVIATVLKQVAQRIAAKQLARYVPFAGQAVAASISFGAIKLIAHAHIADCVAVAEKVAAESR